MNQSLLSPNQVFSVNPHRKEKVKYIGNEKNPLIIIDNFSNHPEELVSIYQSTPEKTQAKGNENYYPGQHANVHPQYSKNLYDAIKPHIKNEFNLPAAYLERIFSDYSVINKPEDKLTKLQSIPHYDSLGAGHIAVLHYLCEPTFLGTAFYRHSETGIETMTRSKKDTYQELVNQQVNEPDFSTGYFSSDIKHYECIDKVDIVYNRVVIYRSQQLHSSLFKASHLPLDGQLGRLTLRSFLFF